MSDQPEALRLADLWEKHSHGYARTPEARTAACLRRQHAEIEALKEELETERVRLAACGVVAMANTPETAAKFREMNPEYRSASCDDVAKAVDREMALRAERDALQADAERYRWLRVRNEDGVDPLGPYVMNEDGDSRYPTGAEIDAAIDAAREAGK